MWDVFDLQAIRVVARIQHQSKRSYLRRSVIYLR